MGDVAADKARMPLPVRLLALLVRAMNALAAIAGIVMTVLVFSGAVMRYFLGSPLKFSDELVGLLFLSLSFLAIPLGLLQRSHISVDLVSRKLRGVWARVAEISASLIFIAFATVFVSQAYEFASFSRMIDSRSELGSLVLWPWMGLMAAAFFIALLVALIQLWDCLRRMAGRTSWLEPEEREISP
ncbi:TRAP transporter small permease [Ferruginivarius sediminum]|uniref:TRAP transporter small permease protein n=1 Tax=Ferruginivarius sediminum TaxID=2661937 RepID=A0A369T7H5_9PROT|nr:TRAP transporter small permease [Ferruginivarius sediminum]RDD61228.1 TRAP transporter small permease [Ferruginivarius sediminum]